MDRALQTLSQSVNLPPVPRYTKVTGDQMVSLLADYDQAVKDHPPRDPAITKAEQDLHNEVLRLAGHLDQNFTSHQQYLAQLNTAAKTALLAIQAAQKAYKSKPSELARQAMVKHIPARVKEIVALAKAASEADEAFGTAWVALRLDPPKLPEAFATESKQLDAVRVRLLNGSKLESARANKLGLVAKQASTFMPLVAQLMKADKPGGRQPLVDVKVSEEHAKEVREDLQSLYTKTFVDGWPISWDKYKQWSTHLTQFGQKAKKKTLTAPDVKVAVGFMSNLDAGVKTFSATAKTLRTTLDNYQRTIPAPHLKSSKLIKAELKTGEKLVKDAAKIAAEAKTKQAAAKKIITTLKAYKFK